MILSEIISKFDNNSAKLKKVEQNGVAPDNFYSTTNLPTYVNLNGQVTIPYQPRMDGVIVLDRNKKLKIEEINKLKIGDLIILGEKEDGSQGIYVSSEIGNLSKYKNEEENSKKENFSFMQSSTSRENPIFYDQISDVIQKCKTDKNGKIVWVLGPAVAHSRSTEYLEWLVENQYVDVIFGGNAIAVHDLEHSLYGTTLGMDDFGKNVENGHRKHMDTINAIRKAGSIKNAVNTGLINSGLMYTLEKNKIPYVLAGSIRDDGPLPDTITDSLKAQDKMRLYTKDANCIISIATALHSIATGNMTPSYRGKINDLKQVEIICVDTSEFVVNKLMDRGTHQAYGAITNARDFLNLTVNKLKYKSNNLQLDYNSQKTAYKHSKGD